MVYSTNTGASANFVGSTVVASGVSYETGFGIFALGQETQFRITISGYTVEEAPDFPAGFEWGIGDDYDSQDNTSSSPTTEFTPNPMIFTAPNGGDMGYRGPAFSEGNYNATYTMLIEVWTDGPEPPTPPSGGRVFVARHQFRAYAGASTALRCWIRDEAGRHDLSGAEVSVLVKRPNGYVIATLPATGSDQGEVTFEVTADTVSQQLAPGVFNVEIQADGSVVGLGHLEVLG